ncbi:Hypothetical predicted protein [Paramuricea clavata]|uniref:Uncharacterized protein n=1 Tax=Paramuricea clavata TaxID=317549 RepID=A0A6S7HAB9_PARCT|nr:Hypothetical predicted protein [Paramuricea clavata]
MQRELDEFRDTVWNSHWIRTKKDTLLADGVPNHIYEFPSRYGMEKKGFLVSQEDLEEIAELSGILDAPDDFIPSLFRKDLNELMPNPEAIKCNEFVQTYLLLKQRYFEKTANNNPDI